MIYIATFTPQAWINDHAVAVDAEGENRWDVTSLIEKAEELERSRLLAGDDSLREDPNAPEWIREWSGPFDVAVEARATESSDDDDAEDKVDWPNLSIDIPDSDGSHGRGFRDALESIRLALAASGVDIQIIKDACFTAIEAYGNNADQAYEICDLMVASTAHLLPSERDWDEHTTHQPLQCGSFVSMSSQYGPVFYLNPEMATHLKEVRSDGSMLTKESDGLRQILNMAIKLGARYLKFDADGQILAGVPTYDDEGQLEAA